jgi:hypothetical protein
LVLGTLSARALRAPVFKRSLTSITGPLRDPHSAHNSFAVPFGDVDDYRETATKNLSLGKNPRKRVQLLLLSYSSMMQLQAALWI